MLKLSVIDFDISGDDFNEKVTEENRFKITDEGVKDVVNNCLEIKEFIVNFNNIPIISQTIKFKH
jgi:predicted transcriptional regulator